MKKVLLMTMAVLTAATVLFSCTEKNYGNDIKYEPVPLFVSVVPDFSDGAVDTTKGTITFNVRPLGAADSLAKLNTLSIYSFDVVSVKTKADSPVIKVTGASCMGEKLQLSVTYTGFDPGENYSASLNVRTERDDVVSAYFNLKSNE